MTSTEIQRRNSAGADVAPAVQGELTIEQLVEQAKKIQQAMKAVMREGEHYGVIPGTGGKPTLLKPGAEKLCLLFRLDPQYEVIRSTEADNLVSYTVRATIYHAPTGNRLASGMGQANSREGKYRYRWEATEEKPTKKEAEEIKAKGLGRWRKISGQWVWHVRVENDNALDQANTLLKMACKRALVAGILNATAASDIFTQDLEELSGQAGQAGQAGQTQADPEAVAVLRQLAEQAAALDPKLWAEPVVLKNASARFGRQITSYEQLSPDEAGAIVAGARSWLEANHQEPRADEPEPLEEPETVPAAEVEVVESGGDGNRDSV